MPTPWDAPLPWDAPIPWGGGGSSPGIPAVTGLDVTSGPAAGGTTVTISGTNLLGAIGVKIGGVDAPITSNTDTQIVVTTGAHAAKTVHTVVTTAGGSSAKTDTDKFTYTSSGGGGTATVLGVSPASGSYAGGTTVTITVDSSTGISAVSFDGLPAQDVHVADATHVTCTSPAHPPGPADVVVTNGSGDSGITPADVFTYLPPTPSTPNSRRWTIHARDSSFVRRGQIEDFTSLTFVQNWNDVGSFILSLPADSPMVDVLTAPQAGIIVSADDQVVFSGPVRDILRENKGGLQTLTISGPDDNFWLSARLAHPVPTVAAPWPPPFNDYDQQPYDSREGAASTVIREFVNVNLGPGALSRRRHPFLSLAADPAIGGDIIGAGRWQPLLTLVQQLALEAAPILSFGIRQSGQALIFWIDTPTDRSGSVIFSLAAGTLGDFSWERVGPAANYVYAGGSNPAPTFPEFRWIAEAEDGGSINQWGLVEEFLDRRDIGGIATLRQAAAAEVAQQAPSFRTDLTIVSTAGIEWNKDYQLGDRVSAIVDGVRLVELIRSVQVDLGPNGDTQTIVPSVSSPSRKRTVQEQQTFVSLRDLASRIINLERNQ